MSATISVRVDPAIKERLENLAKILNTSASELVREAIEVVMALERARKSEEELAKLIEGFMEAIPSIDKVVRISVPVEVCKEHMPSYGSRECELVIEAKKPGETTYWRFEAKLGTPTVWEVYVAMVRGCCGPTLKYVMTTPPTLTILRWLLTGVKALFEA